jgi:uncharacterized protein GlcG (DUF336 family)
MRKACRSSFYAPVIVTGSVLLAAASASAQGLPAQKYLPAGVAEQAVMTAMEACKSQGYHVSAAVVDPAGNLRAFVREDTAGPHTILSAQKKAFTAASLKQPTAGPAEAVAKNPTLEGLRNMDDRILILAGGLPIKAGEDVIGGIGVGGAPAGEKDQACAQAALDKIAGIW